MGKWQRYAKGATVMRIAETGNWAAVLSSGRVRVIGLDGTRTIAMRGVGDIVGEQAVIDGKPRSATVRADIAVRALVLGGREFDRVLGRHPHILRVLCTVVSERLREADRNLGSQGSDTVTRVSRLLVRQADEYEVDGEREVRVNIGSQAGLGESLGLSRESAVRALRVLREANIIRTRRGVVTILDLGALRDCAG
ncbi:Crp/Fnr family transcriptional regulator [Kibdelosporangium banguiense]|nr:Crp/Fnr family transcriptional regulator [Kibdelosporangium banguiense]